MGKQAVIWKFDATIGNVTIQHIPGDPIFLDVQMQGGMVCIWAIVYPGEPTSLGSFHVIGTGHTFDSEFLEKTKYIGTVQDNGLVWHVFAEKRGHHGK